MGDRLADYVLPKVPVADLAACAGRAVVRPCAGLEDLSTHLHKPGGKRFNWRRPTYRRKGGVLYCRVLPGVDYTWHYARLAATAAGLLGFEPAVTVDLPDHGAAVAFIERTMPEAMKVPEVVLLGYVSHLFPAGQQWRSGGGFGWRFADLGTSRVALVGAEFSYWGDLAGAVVTVLANRGARWVIYVGKLGTLRSGLEPNRWVATGTCSLIEGQWTTWSTRLADEARREPHALVGQCHATVPSVVDETLAWYRSAMARVDLVDPEIGRMATAASAEGIAYDYLHIVSDNLTGDHHEGLYRERSHNVATARWQCLRVIESILSRALA